MKKRIVISVAGLAGVMLVGGALAAPTSCPSASNMANYIANNYKACNKNVEYYRGYHCEHAYYSFSQWKSAASEKRGGIAIQENSTNPVFPDLEKGSIMVNKPLSVNPTKAYVKGKTIYYCMYAGSTYTLYGSVKSSPVLVGITTDF